MSEVTDCYHRERRGGPPYHPRMMVKVLLYGYCVGVSVHAASLSVSRTSPSGVGGEQHTVLPDPPFRKDNVDALSGLRTTGEVSIAGVKLRLDGTKVQGQRIEA